MIAPAASRQGAAVAQMFVQHRPSIVAEVSHAGPGAGYSCGLRKVGPESTLMKNSSRNGILLNQTLKLFKHPN